MTPARKKVSETQSFAPILDRALVVDHVTTHFADFVEVLEDLTDYGTHLIPRCWQSSDRRLADVVVLGVLTKQAVAMLDAGHALISQGLVVPALLQLRALFEVSVYLSWTLRRDTERRSRAFYVANLRKRLNWALRARKGTPEFKALKQDYARLGSLGGFADHQTEAVAEIDRLQGRLRSSDLRQMNAAFVRRRGKRRYDPEWYTVLFPKKHPPSLFTLAKQTGRRADYRLIYEQGSEMMHSSRMEPHVKMDHNGLRLRSLRDLTDLPLIAQLLIGQTMISYGLVLERYRPSESENFAKKYVANWRAVLLAKRVVNYNYIERVID